MREQNLIESDLFYQDLMNEAQNLNGMNGTLVNYAWVNFPLPYVQAGFIKIWTFTALFSRVFLLPDNDDSCLLLLVHQAVRRPIPPPR